MGMMKGYDPTGFFDEMFDKSGEVLPHYRKFQEMFGKLSLDDFEGKRHSVDLAFLRGGVTFNVYGDARGQERIFPFDLVPRIIPASEWQIIERGLTQRIIALNPRNPDAYLVKGTVEQMLNNKTGAKAAYLEYLKLAPHGKDAADVRAILPTL